MPRLHVPIERPVLPLVCFFALGIWAGWRLRYSVEPMTWDYWLVALTMAATLCYRLPVLSTRLLFVAVLSWGAAWSAVAIFSNYLPVNDVALAYEGVVASEPAERDGKLSFDLLMTSRPFEGRTIRATIIRDTLLRANATLRPLDGICARSLLRQPTNRKGAAFDYERYALAHGIQATTYITEWNWSSRAVSLALLTPFDRARLRLLRLRHDITRSNLLMPPTVAAMAFGDKSGIDKATRQAFSDTGVAHTLALSGLHMSLLYMIVLGCFRFVRYALSKYMVLLSLVWLYVLFVGMPLSAVRAATMLTFLTLARLLGRDAFSLSSVATAAFVLLVVHPLALFDVGFQLSFVSVAFIVAYASTFEHIVRAPRHLRWLWKSLVVCCVAQLATAPLVACYFGSLPLWFVPANIVAVPFVCVAIVSGLLLLTPAAPFISPLITWLTECLMRWLHILQSLPCSTIATPHIGPTYVIVSYAIIIFAANKCARLCIKKEERLSLGRRRY